MSLVYISAGLLSASCMLTMHTLASHAVAGESCVHTLDSPATAWEAIIRIVSVVSIVCIF